VKLNDLRKQAKQGIDPEDAAKKARLEKMRVNYRQLRELLDRGMIVVPKETDIKPIGDGTWWIGT